MGRNKIQASFQSGKPGLSAGHDQRVFAEGLVAISWPATFVGMDISGVVQCVHSPCLAGEDNKIQDRAPNDRHLLGIRRSTRPRKAPRKIVEQEPRSVAGLPQSMVEPPGLDRDFAQPGIVCLQNYLSLWKQAL